MSQIDAYEHICVGRLVRPIYIMQQLSIENDYAFEFDSGDILIGGGHGESEALKIKSNDNAVIYYLNYHYLQSLIVCSLSKELQSELEALYDLACSYNTNIETDAWTFESYADYSTLLLRYCDVINPDYFPRTTEHIININIGELIYFSYPELMSAELANLVSRLVKYTKYNPELRYGHITCRPPGYPE